MSEVKVDKISPRSGTDVTLGDSGDTFTIPSGATIDASAATATGFDSGLASVQTFTSSGTWTRPTDITKVIMEVQGGGGGGGKGASGDYNMCGASGGYCKKFLDVSSISTSTITVGSGGTSVAYDASANGGDGGSSSWADGTNTVTAGGGDGGDNSAAYVISVGGTATGGDINVPGQSVQAAATTPPGASMYGQPGCWVYSTSAAGTENATGYGAGGTTWSGYASHGTGTGSPGIVIVWEYK